MRFNPKTYRHFLFGVPEEIMFWLIARLRNTAIIAWHSLAKWKWDAIFSGGWGIMLAAGEYLLALCSLGVAGIAAISQVAHWSPRETNIRSARTWSVVFILAVFVLMTLITLANKGEKTWSPTWNFIATRLANHIPMSSPPNANTPADYAHYLRIPLPKGVTIGLTNPTVFAELRRELETIHKRRATDKPVAAEPPDFGVVIVNPKYPFANVVPINGIGAHELRMVPLLWDIDESTITQSLSVNESDFAWLRGDTSGTTLGVVKEEDVKNRIKPGNRIFGFVTLSCPLCKKNRAYWIYFIWGQGGWYSEIVDDQIPSPKKISDNLPAIRDNPDTSLAFIPISSRKPIGENE